MRRKGLILAVLLFACLAFSTAALAYNGGVTVYITGGYAYHRADCSYPATYTPTTLENAVAMGKTPCSRCRPPILGVDSDTDTEPYHRPSSRSSSSGSGGGSTSSVAATPKPTPTKVTAQVAEEPERHTGLYAAGVGFALYLIYKFNEDKIQERQQKRRAAQASASVARALERTQKYKEEREEQKRLEREQKRPEYERLYGGVNPLYAANAPSGDWLDDDLLPCSPGPGDWGGKYTFYTSRTGETFHRTCGCCSARIPTNAFRISSKLRPCRNCRPVKPNMLWVREARRIQKIKNEYNIP